MGPRALLEPSTVSLQCFCLLLFCFFLMVYVLVTLTLASFPRSLAHLLSPGFEPIAVCCLPFAGFCLFLCPRAPSTLTSHLPHQWLGEEQPLWLHSTATHSAQVLLGSLLRRREVA